MTKLINKLSKKKRDNEIIEEDPRLIKNIVYGRYYEIIDEGSKSNELTFVLAILAVVLFILFFLSGL